MTKERIKKVKTLKQLEQHEAVRELYTEDHSQDYWVDLNNGWVCSENYCNSMHCEGAKNIVNWFNTYIEKIK